MMMLFVGVLMLIEVMVAAFVSWIVVIFVIIVMVVVVKMVAMVLLLLLLFAFFIKIFMSYGLLLGRYKVRSCSCHRLIATCIFNCGHDMFGFAILNLWPSSFL